MHPFRLIARLVRPLMKPLSYVLALTLPPLLVLAVGFVGATLQNPLAPPPALAGPLPDRPAHDPTKPIAVVLAGNAGTEVSDLFGPYETLAASGAFNVYVVAPERKLTPIVPVPVQHCCAAMDLMPHYSFAEYDQLIGAAPDVIVVPYIPLAAPGQADAAVLAWLRERPGERTIVLSICGGAQMVADSGILDGHTATSHHTILRGVKQTHPAVDWVSGVRYVDDGRFISSAGVASGVDATLYTLQRFIGRDGALATARRIGYPHTEFLDDRTWEVPAESDLVTFPNLWRADRTQIGLFLYPGVDELALSSVTDTYPRALATDVLTIGTERTMIRTRHGLDVVPRYSLDSAPTPDRMLIPGTPDAAVVAPMERWTEARVGRAAEYIHAGGGYAYDLTLADMAQQETRPIARNTARWIEYPTMGLDLGGRDWQPTVALRVAGLSLLGLAILLGVKRVRGWGRSPTSSGPEQPRRMLA